MLGTAIDPVCGMKVGVESARWVTPYEGQSYYFCCEGCLAKFVGSPESYLGERKPQPELVSIGSSVPQKTGSCCGSGGHVTAPVTGSPGAGSGFTCPMHPEVISERMAACPKCGMALEPIAPVGLRVEYICPMHPEVVKDGPGSCPICGMALEPKEVTGDAPNPELESMTRKLWVSAALTLPLLL